MPADPAKKKYKLSSAGAEGARECAFFSSAAGCRSGEACKFIHPGLPTAGSKAAGSGPKAVATDSAIAITSEPVTPAASGKKSKKRAAEAQPTVVSEPSQVAVEPVAKKAKKATEPKKSSAITAAVAAVPTQSVNVQKETVLQNQAAQQPRPKAVCVFFRKGKCQNGEGCQFSHVLGVKTRGPSRNSETGRALAAAKAAAQPNGTVQIKPVAKAKAKKDKVAVAIAAPTVVEPSKPKQTASAKKAAKPIKQVVVAEQGEIDEHQSDGDVPEQNPAVASEQPAVTAPQPTQTVAKAAKRKSVEAKTLSAVYDGDDPFGLSAAPVAKRPRPERLSVPAPAPELKPILAAAVKAAAVVAPKPGVKSASKSPVSKAKAVRATSVVRLAVKTPVATAAAETVLPPVAASESAARSFHSVLADLPISPFPAPQVKAKSAGKSKSKVALPEPISHPRADVWAELVARTQAHPAFAATYTFKADSSWVAATPCGPHCTGMPQVLALDCEMCMTKDDYTGELNGKDLVRLSIIEGTGALALDTLVRPQDRVVEMRSAIHGVTAHALQDCAFDLTHAQIAMSKLCCPCTVLVGHALHNDLMALKMQHTCVVDTALLFSVADRGDTARPSLRDVAKTLLDKDIQAGAHDSVTDARTALEIATIALNTPVAELPQIIRGIAGPKLVHGRSGSSAGLAGKHTLLVHRIPPVVQARHISAMFGKKAMIVPQAVGEPEFAEGAQHGKAVAAFPSQTHADLAFATLPGTAKADATGRLQKKVYMATGEYIRVRQMYRAQSSDKQQSPQPQSNSDEDQDSGDIVGDAEDADSQLEEAEPVDSDNS